MKHLSVLSILMAPMFVWTGDVAGQEKPNLRHVDMAQLVEYWNDPGVHAKDDELIRAMSYKAVPTKTPEEHAALSGAVQANVKIFTSVLTEAIREDRARKKSLLYLGQLDSNAITNDIAATVIACLDDTAEIKRPFSCGVHITSIQKEAENCLRKHLVSVEPQVIKLLTDSNPVRRASAARILKPYNGLLGGKPTEALLAAANDPDPAVKFAIATTLENCAAKYATQANRVLRDYYVLGNADLREQVLRSTYFLAPRSLPADRQMTITRLLEGYATNRIGASSYLRLLIVKLPQQDDVDQIVSGLIPLLDGERGYYTAGIIASAGPRSSAATEPLRTAMNAQTDLKLQVSFARALFRVTKKPSDVLEVYRRALASENALVVSRGASGARELGPKAASLLPGLIAALNHESKSVRHSSIKALGTIGSQAAVALPKLNQLLKSNDKYDVSYSKKAIWAIKAKK